MNLTLHVHKTKPHQKRKSDGGQFHGHVQTKKSDYTNSLFTGACGCSSCTTVVLHGFNFRGFVAACAEECENAVSWARHLRDFQGECLCLAMVLSISSSGAV